MSPSPCFLSDASGSSVSFDPLAASRRAAAGPGEPAPNHGVCWCARPDRRLFTGLLVAGGTAALLAPLRPALAQDGVQGDVGRGSRVAKLVPAEQVEGAAVQQYREMLAQASAQRALGGPEHPQVVRLRAIAQRIVPFAPAWNGRAANWRWEVNLLGSAQINAFCMPAGKIAFYSGILQKLQLSDDEVATIMGHEMAHALREHARARLAKTVATRGAIEVGAALFGLGSLGRGVADLGGQLLTLQFSRSDETEADIVGMDLAARAGYDPAAGVTLWQKMMKASQGAPPQFLSTHPAGGSRIREIQEKLPKVQPLYQRAPKPDRKYGPPPAA